MNKIGPSSFYDAENRLSQGLNRRSGRRKQFYFAPQLAEKSCHIDALIESLKPLLSHLFISLYIRHTFQVSASILFKITLQ